MTEIGQVGSRGKEKVDCGNMSFESLTPEDILVNLRNTQSETFSKLCELMATNFEKLRSMENLLNEIKGKVEKLENAVPAEVEDNEEPKSQGTLEKEFAESLMVKLENMEKEKVGASTSILWPVQVEEGDEHDEKPDKKPGKLTGKRNVADCQLSFQSLFLQTFTAMIARRLLYEDRVNLLVTSR